MKQIAQRLRDGRVELLDVPAPDLTPDGALVEVRASLLSAGTERSKIEAGRQSLVGKARSRPDQVRQVLDKARTDGVQETARAVRARLDQASPLGYSAAGVVLAVGSRVRDLVPGDRVACGGGDHAVHAEVDLVPGNLCVPLPDAVGFEEGAFATLGSIALHGVRQAHVQLGERVAVIGLGLVGQLTGQLLRAAGCSVLGIDLSPVLVEKAIASGAADVAQERRRLDAAARPPDCDAVIITAAAKSADPVELAAQLCRDRGRVVIVGEVTIDVPRGPYYGKELEVRLSRSYGPGRYDREYEERGLDYPIGYVRWTERRNMAAFLDLVRTKKVDVRTLITSRVPFEEAPEAYERLVSRTESPLGIVLEYPGETPALVSGHPQPSAAAGAQGSETIATGLIGAGSFAQRILIPALRGEGFALRAIASASGLSAASAAGRFAFDRAERPEELISAEDIDLVVIATRHSTHARLAMAALQNGKAVFVEKPPCMNLRELTDLERAESESGRLLAVGFNRRHAPAAELLREHVRRRDQPVELLYRVNAGRLPSDHWLLDPEEGGGRLVGEGCHFIDFACWVVGHLPTRVVCFMRPDTGQQLGASQSFSAILDFPDGSLATVIYEAGGAVGLGKEYVEAHAGGASAVLDNFKRLALHTGKKTRRVRGLGDSKGHQEEFIHLARLLRATGSSDEPHPLETMRVTLAAQRSAETGRAVTVGELREE